MKKIFLIVAFLFSAFVSFSQVIPKPNPTAVGIGYKRLLADSTIFIPTGGAIPRLGANNINRRSAIYADTINKKLYVFYPNDSTWKESGTDTASLSARIDARVKYADTSSMLAPYLRTANSHGVPSGGTSGQLLSKNSDSDYDLVWIDNYADWTSLIKQQYKATESITKGQAVYISGADGTNALISKASNASEITSSKTIGLLAQTLSTNGKGFVVTEGLLGGLNTATAIAGDPVWLGVNGDLIFGYLNKPHAPAHLVYLGVVTRANGSNGEILIKPQNGFEVKELHDVSAQSPSNNDGLFYNNSNSLWETKSIATALGYTPANAANFVPYTGATADVDLGNHNLRTNYSITSKNTVNARTIFINGNDSTEGDLLGFKQYPSTFGGTYKTTAISAVNNNSLNFTFWHDTASGGWLRYKSVVFKTDSLDISGPGRQYYFPNASGVLALKGDLTTGYVPYTGATTNVNLGYKNISATDLFINPTAANGAGSINWKLTSASTNYALNNPGYFSLYTLGTYYLGGTWNNGGITKSFLIHSASIPDNTTRYYGLPGSDGTFALTSDITSALASYVTLGTDQTITGNKTFSNDLKTAMVSIANSNTLYSRTGYTTLSASSVSTTGWVGFSWGNTNAATLSFNNAAQYTYTFPAANGTVALTSDLTTGYVPYTGATQNVDLGANNLVSRHLIVNGLSGSYGGSLLLKQNANAGLSNNYTSISSSGLNFIATAVNGAGVLYEATFNLASITTNRSYTLPNASGTVALTSDIPSLSNYVTLDGTQTISGQKTFSNSITNFNNPVVNGVNVLNFKSAAVTDAVISVDTVFTQFQSFGSYGYLFKMKDGTNGLAIRNDGSGFQLNLPFSGSSGVFSSTLTSLSSVKGTNFILSGGTGNTGLYYGHTDRVVLANYTAGGIDFETNGGAVNMTLFGNGNLGVGTSLTDDGVNKLQVAGSGKFTGNVGIGISPSSPIDISINTPTAIAWTRPGTSGKRWGLSSDNVSMSINNTTDGTQPLTIVNGGNVGIGTMNPQGGGGSTDRTLSINSGAGAASFLTGLVGDVKYSTLFTSNSQVVLETNASIPLIFNINNARKGSFYSNGDFEVGYVNSLNNAMLFHWNGASSYGSIQTASSSNLVLNPGGNNVGVGTTSPSRKFVVSNGGAEGVEINPGTGYNTIISYNRATSTWLPLVLQEGTGNVLVGSTSDPGYKLFVNGSMYINNPITISQPVGSPTLDGSGSFTTLANGAYVDFPSMSGMIVVNNLGTGAVQVFICGGGNVLSLGYVVNATGTMTHSPGVGGYRFTNNTGSAWPYSFQVFKTRGTA